jgi:glycosyltransferase involved in cell wall biosynthesis
MKILFASSSSGSRGGGETFLVYLGEALARRGHEVVLWTSSHPRMDEIAARFAPFGSVHRANYTNTYDRSRRSLAALLDRRTPARAAREWEALRPDIVHVNKQNLEDALDLLHATRQSARPSVCTIHITQSAAFLGAKGAGLRDWAARRGLRGYCSYGGHGGALVTVSEARKADLEAFLGRSAAGTAQIAAIANGVPAPPALSISERTRRRTELGLAPEDLAILAVGRMTAQKRPLLFLEIAARIATRVPQAKFFWIGDGPLAAEWDTRAAALGIGSRAQRLGWREDVAPLLASGDLLLHTAEYEGMPLAILEAMAAGLPCAVSESLHREMPFLDESNSFRVSDDSWIELLQDRTELSRRAVAARNLAMTRFSTDAMAMAYEQLYKNVTAFP